MTMTKKKILQRQKERVTEYTDLNLIALITIANTHNANLIITSNAGS